jgi:purine-binding chemotaxis protein CheW
MTAYLLVRSGSSKYGLRLSEVLEVLEIVEVVPVPSSHHSVRGVSPVHGRLIPRIALSAFLADGPPTGDASSTIIVARGGGQTVALEVDDVDLAMQDVVLPLPASWHGPGAVGVVRHGGELVPLLDVEALVARVAGAGHPA